MPRTYRAFVKGDNARQLEAQAMLQAQDFFGSGVKLSICPDYSVSMYGDGKHGAVIDIQEEREEPDA